MREFEQEELPFGMASQTLERVESEDEEYDVYLFWPSAQRRDQRELGSPTPSSTSSPADVLHPDLHFYGPISPSLSPESLKLDQLDELSDLQSFPVTPVLASGASEFRFPAYTSSGSAENVNAREDEAPRTSYSKVIELGLFFSQFTHRAAVSFFRRLIGRKR